MPYTTDEVIEGVYTEVYYDNIENYSLFYNVGSNICKEQKASASYIRSIAGIGYSKAMKLIKEFQKNNVIGNYIEKIKSYEVLISLNEFKNKFKGDLYGL
ncbi:hypothetical protein KHQ81_15920 (plasmid) [Mycoplasmatota bacterium]|nr:hypothetical protein KHQ81_15920 [Mycoplasmatota bacterium]